MTTLSYIEDLARRLCYEADPSSVWAAEDEVTRLYYRRQAQQRYAAEHYLPSRHLVLLPVNFDDPSPTKHCYTYTDESSNRE